MFQDTIDTLAATPAECPVRRDLTHLAAGLDTRFLHAGTMLADAIRMVDRIIGGLDGIVAALDERTAGAAVADLADVADRLTVLPATLAVRSGRLTRIAGTASALHQQVLDMHRILRVLNIYGMNIKIAASGEEQFVGFVDGMNARLAMGQQQLDGVIGKLKELEAGLGTARQVDRLLAAECGKVVPAAPRRLAADAAGLKDHLDTVSTLAQRVAVIARSIQAKVAVLLGALQVGDSTRQRLEHVVSALQLVEAHDCGAADAAFVDRLLAAQLNAAAQDFSREITALIASLAGLVPDAHALADLIAQQAGDDGRAFLLRLDESVTGVTQVVIQLQSAHAQAQSMAALISEAVVDLTGRVQNLSGIRLDVQDIATNTRLLCRRQGGVGRAVSVVATEVDVYARELGNMTAEVSQTIATLSDTPDLSHDDDAGRDIGDALGGALDVIREACRQSGQVVLEGNDDARRLIDLLRTAVAGFEAEPATTDLMQDAAAILAERSRTDAPPPPGEALPVLLNAIAQLYTMAREREVHADFARSELGIETVAVEEEEDDDGLF